MANLFQENILNYALLILSIIVASLSLVKPLFNKIWSWFIFEYVEWRGRQFKKKLDKYSNEILSKINDVDLESKERFDFINDKIDELKEDVKEQNRILMKFFLKNKD